MAEDDLPLVIASENADARRRDLAEDTERSDALCAIDGGLTAWEVDFVESITAQVEAGRCLTEKQRDLADRLLEKYER